MGDDSESRRLSFKFRPRVSRPPLEYLCHRSFPHASPHGAILSRNSVPKRAVDTLRPRSSLLIHSHFDSGLDGRAPTRGRASSGTLMTLYSRHNRENCEQEPIPSTCEWANYSSIEWVVPRHVRVVTRVCSGSRHIFTELMLHRKPALVLICIL
jgi:hypothetical protein